MSKSFTALYRPDAEPVDSGKRVGIIAYSSNESDLDNSRSNLLAPVALTVRNVYVDVTANTLDGAAKFIFARENLSTALEVNVAAAATGAQSNTTVGLALAAGESFRLVIDTNEATTGTISYRSIVFEIDPDASGETVTIVGSNASGETHVDVASGTDYITTVGRRANSLTEANVQRLCPVAGTGQDFAVNIGNNARTTDTTFRPRINGANATPTVTITPTDDGTQIRDTSNTAAIAVDDLINAAATTGTGTEQLTVEKVGFTLVASSGQFFSAYASGDSGSSNLSTSTTYYLAVGGGLPTLPSTTESEAEITVPFDCDVKRIYGRYASNGYTGSSTITLRVNGVDSALTFDIAASNTSNNDDTGTVSLSAGDTICFKLDTASLGTTARLAEVGVVYESSATGGAGPSTAIRRRQIWTEKFSTNTTTFSHTFDDNGGEGAVPDADNLLVFGVAIRGGGDSFTAPPGWTMLYTASTGSEGYAVGYRTATGDSNDDLSLVFTNSGRAYGWIAEYENIDSVSLLDGSNFDDSNINTSVTSQQTGSVTPSDSNQKLAVAALLAGQSSGEGPWSNTNDGDISIDSGFSVESVVSGSSSRPCAAFAEKIIESTVALNPTFSTSEAGGHCFASLMVFNGVATGGGSTIAGSQAESAPAGDAISATIIRAVNVSESSPVADSPVSSGLIQASSAESATPSDQQQATALIDGAVTESAPPGDAIAAAATLPCAIAESTGADEQVATSGATGASITESASASDQQAAIATLHAALLENAIPVDAIAAAKLAQSAQAESTSAGDSQTGAVLQVVSAALAESMAAGDSQGALALASASVSEALSVLDRLSVTLHAVVGIRESASPQEQMSAVQLALAQAAESVGAGETLIAVIEGKSVAIFTTCGMTLDRDIGSLILNVNTDLEIDLCPPS